MKSSKKASDNSQSSRRSPRVLLDKLSGDEQVVSLEEAESATLPNSLILGEVTAVSDLKMVEKIETPKSSQTSSSSAASRSNLKRAVKEEVGASPQAKEGGDVDLEPVKKRSKTWKEFDKELEVSGANGVNSAKKINKTGRDTPVQKSHSKKAEKFWYMESCSEDEGNNNPIDEETIKKIRASRHSRLSSKMAQWGLLPNSMAGKSSDDESDEKVKKVKTATPSLKQKTTVVDSAKKSPFPLVQKEKAKNTPIYKNKEKTVTASTTKQDTPVLKVGGRFVKKQVPNNISDESAKGDAVKVGLAKPAVVATKPSPKYIKLTAEEAAKLIASSKVAKHATQSLLDGRKVTILSPQNLSPGLKSKLQSSLPQTPKTVAAKPQTPKPQASKSADQKTGAQKVVKSKQEDAEGKAVTTLAGLQMTSQNTKVSDRASATGPEMISKSLLCRPVMVTKALMCQPIRNHKVTQTEGDEGCREKIILPVPVPFIIPLPLPQGSAAIPYPIPMPLPIPVPLILPTTKQQAELMIKHLQEMKNDLPSDPLEAELIKIAAAIQETNNDAETAPTESKLKIESMSPAANQKSAFLLIEDDKFKVKFSYGVNAYRQWAYNKNLIIMGENSSVSLPSGVRGKRQFKMNLTQMHTDELNEVLSLMLNELRKSTGEEYAPDSVFYLCLGIQQYLRLHGRIDRLFSEVYYRKFSLALDELLKKYHAELSFEGVLLCRVAEEHLWESSVLGVHDPNTLLFTLVYFNTKYFQLFTLDQHIALSFASIVKIVRAGVPDVLKLKKDALCRNTEEDALMLEQPSSKNVLRCPVRLYQFYLSKCKEYITSKTDLYYLAMESTSSPDSPFWFTTNRLDDDVLAMMLRRCLVVKEILEVQFAQINIEN